MTPVQRALLEFQTLPDFAQGGIIAVGLVAIFAAAFYALRQAWTHQSAITRPVKDSNRFSAGGRGRDIASVILSILVLYVISIPIENIWTAFLYNFFGTTEFALLVIKAPLAILTIAYFKQISKLPHLLLGAGGLTRFEKIPTDALLQISNILVFLIGFTTVLHTVGQDITVALALGGFGASIVALVGALSSQHTVANLVCFGALMLDRPFSVGDEITVYYGVNDGTVSGKVSSIGMLSTRLSTDEGTLSIPNKVFSDAVSLTASEQEESDITEPEDA